MQQRRRRRQSRLNRLAGSSTGLHAPQATSTPLSYASPANSLKSNSISDARTQKTQMRSLFISSASKRERERAKLGANTAEHWTRRRTRFGSRRSSTVIGRTRLNSTRLDGRSKAANFTSNSNQNLNCSTTSLARATLSERSTISIVCAGHKRSTHTTMASFQSLSERFL